MASRWTGAAEGAATGASLGTAIAPGYGTAIGAGVGAIGGAIAGGETDAQRLERERMEELMRRQELGTLGLTGQEMQVALGQAQGALSQQQQAQRAQQAGLMASQDLGAGSVFRAQQEEASLKRKEMEGARQKVVERDIAEKRAQEAELMTLAGLAEDRATQEREAMISSLGSLATTTAAAGQAVWQREQAKELLAKQEETKKALLDTQWNKAMAGQDDAAVDAAFAAQGFSFKQNMAAVQTANPMSPFGAIAPDSFETPLIQQFIAMGGDPSDMLSVERFMQARQGMSKAAEEAEILRQLTIRRLTNGQ
jgi:hypothetical protein